ncbi:MAG TPA: FAD-dependent monooxygenase [Burkholderiaceae bacterium]|jgi:2-octaprenyl-6-methoxyphenol hydroxylase|nr:FAD-dependent monooxygenase [Burkholderiaceae bacterium]
MSTLAIIGAGPVGLSLALHAARALPDARITLFDARPIDRDVSADPRTLALSLGSVQLLERLNCWPSAAAQPIHEVHVSQQPPSGLPWSAAEPELRIRAVDEAVPQLGAVLTYGQLLAPLQLEWLSAARQDGLRLTTRFGTAVSALKPVDGGVELDAGIAERFDLAVVAEGGVFAEQRALQFPQGWSHDYGQTAWVGTVSLVGGQSGVAFERFTRHGPAALLPLKADNGTQRAALVWCVPRDDDPVRELNDAQRVAVLNTIFPPAAGQLVGITPLKDFSLGLNAQRTLVDGRTVHIGNAAQTLHPVAGQGLNLGLRDAFELVLALRDAGGDIDRALKRVEWRRAPDRWSMIAATDFLARSFTWQLPGLGIARGLGLSALQRVPPLKSALARQMMFGVR